MLTREERIRFYEFEVNRLFNVAQACQSCGSGGVARKFIERMELYQVLLQHWQNHREEPRH